MGTSRQLIAVFRSEREADEAADALREFGFREDDDLARWELAEGRYLIEGEQDPEPIFDVSRDVVVGALVGAAAGSAWVSIAVWGSVTPLLLLAGALGGAFIGFVVGLEVATGDVASDRDEAPWFTVSDGEPGHVVHVDVADPIQVHTVHALLRDRGAWAFLGVETTLEGPHPTRDEGHLLENSDAVRSSGSAFRADVSEERASAPGTRRCRSCPRRSVPTGSAEHAGSGRASKVR